jgi:hypothetical protein
MTILLKNKPLCRMNCFKKNKLIPISKSSQTKRPQDFTCGLFIERKLILLKLIFLSRDTATKTLGETINTTASINNFLFARVERVASTAHVNVEIFTNSRTGFEVITTTAVDSNFNVIWMNISFHDFWPLMLCRRPINCRVPHQGRFWEARYYQT